MEDPIDFSDHSHEPLRSQSSLGRSSQRSWSGSFSNLDDPSLIRKLLDMNEADRVKMYRKLPEQQAARISETLDAILAEGEGPETKGRHERRLTQVAKLAEHINQLTAQQHVPLWMSDLDSDSRDTLLAIANDNMQDYESWTADVEQDLKEQFDLTPQQIAQLRDFACSRPDDVDVHQLGLSQARKLLHDLSIFLVEDKQVIVKRLCIKYPNSGHDSALTIAEDELEQLHNDFFIGPVTEEILSQELSQLHQYFLDVDKLHEDERDLYEARIESLENDLGQVRSDLNVARNRIVEEKRKNATQDLNKMLSDDDIIQERIEILEIEKDGLVEKLNESNDALEKCKIRLSEMNHGNIQKDHSILEKDVRIKELEEHVELANSQIDEQLGLIDELEHERNDLERELDFWEQEDEHTHTQVLLEEANVQIKNMETRIAEQERAKEHLMSQIRDLRQDVSGTLVSLGGATPEPIMITHDSDAQRILDASSPTPSNMLEQLGDSFKFYPDAIDSDASEVDEEKKQLDPSQMDEDMKEDETSKLKKELEESQEGRHQLQRRVQTLTTDLQDLRQSKINIIQALSMEIDRMRAAFVDPLLLSNPRAATIS